MTMRLPCTVMEIWRLKYSTHGPGHGKKNERKKRERGKEEKRKVEKEKEEKGEEEK